MEKLSPSMKDYLRVIYSIYQLGNRNHVRVQDISSHMNLAKSSASRAANFLSQKGLLQKGHYTTIAFTETGKKQAQFIVERQHMIRQFLCHVLDINDKTAQKDACNLEHVISIECYQSICNYMEQLTADCPSRNF